MEVQSQKGEEVMGNCVGNLVFEAEKASDSSAKILETVVVGIVSLSESEKVASKSSDGAVEGSGMGKKSDEERVEKKTFDVLRFLSEISNEKRKNPDNMNLLEVAKACGMTFLQGGGRKALTVEGNCETIIFDVLVI